LAGAKVAIALQSVVADLGLESAVYLRRSSERIPSEARKPEKETAITREAGKLVGQTLMSTRQRLQSGGSLVAECLEWGHATIRDE
jgi:hypothetical protein